MAMWCGDAMSSVCQQRASDFFGKRRIGRKRLINLDGFCVVESARRECNATSGVRMMTESCMRGGIVSRALLPTSPAAEQTMAMPATRRRWTASDVRDLMDESRPWPRYELIAGELIVTPSPGHPHQLLVGELHMLIAPYIDQVQAGLTLLSPSDLALQEGTVTQPDIYVVPAGPHAAARDPACSDMIGLLLAVEVISPSSVRTDRVTKRDFYMESNVAEYWIVDPDARVIERWTPDRETPRVEHAMLTWQPAGASTALTIELPALFDRLQQKTAWARAFFSRPTSA